MGILAKTFEPTLGAIGNATPGSEFLQGVNSMNHPFIVEKLDTRTVRIAAERTVFGDIFKAWISDPGHALAFNALLAEMPGTAFRWELPALDRSRLDQPFECVVVDSPDLDVQADRQPFAAHFDRAGDRSVIRFANLGADAELIVPCPVGPDKIYAHLAIFARQAPVEQQQALWHLVGKTMLERVGTRPLWLSTAGSGVAWLHVRIDNRPKYYVHAPFRREL